MIKLDQGILTLCERVIRSVEQTGSDDVLGKASCLLAERITDGFRSIHTLRLKASHVWLLDGATILRTCYDAMLQLLYIHADQGERTTRAQLFIGYIFIEQHLLLAMADPTWLKSAGHLEPDSQRALNERELHRVLKQFGDKYLTEKGRREFATAGVDYLVSRTAKYIPNWYAPKKTKELAESVGYAYEFAFFQRHLSQSVHSSSIALFSGRHESFSFDTEFQLTLARTISLRAAGALAETFDLPLNSLDKYLIGQACIALLDDSVLRPR